MAVNKGDAYVETDTGGVGAATRYWALRTANTAGDPADRATWQGTAGTSVTVYFKTGSSGGVPPNVADTVILEARRSDGTLIEQFHNGAPPADGTSYTLHFTNNGNSGGGNRCGGVELYVRATFDGVAGDYDVDSQNTAAVGNITAFSRGLLRSNAQFTSSLTHGGYPAGSTYAYGAAGDENITLSAPAHTQPYVSAEGQIRIDALDVTTVQASGTAQDYTGTTSSQIFVANNTFDDAAKSYGVQMTPVGNSFITPDSGAVLWTTFVDAVGGPTVEQNGDSVRRQSFYDVDPRITTAAPTIGETIYNIGELATIDIATITNARAENLTRSISFIIADSGGVTQTTVADTGPNYDVDYTIQVGDTAVGDLVGDQWQVRTNQSDVDSQPFQNVYAVSSFYYVDVHTQLDPTLAPDDFPTDDANEDSGFVILGDTAYTWVHVEGVRNDGTEIDTSGMAVTLVLKTPSGGISQTFNIDTEPDPTNGTIQGWTPRVDIEPTTPAGDWTLEADVAFTGNTGADVEGVTFITPLTSNLYVVLIGPTLFKDGQAHRFYARTEIDNLATDPQTLPTWRLFDSLGAEVSSGNMKNAVDDTETINGAVYYVTTADLGDPASDRYTLWAEAQLNGNPIKNDANFRAYNDKYDLIASKLGNIGPP